MRFCIRLQIAIFPVICMGHKDYWKMPHLYFEILSALASCLVLLHQSFRRYQEISYYRFWFKYAVMSVYMDVGMPKKQWVYFCSHICVNVVLVTKLQLGKNTLFNPPSLFIRKDHPYRNMMQRNQSYTVTFHTISCLHSVKVCVNLLTNRVMVQITL